MDCTGHRETRQHNLERKPPIGSNTMMERAEESMLITMKCHHTSSCERTAVMAVFKNVALGFSPFVCAAKIIILESWAELKSTEHHYSHQVFVLLQQPLITLKIFSMNMAIDSWNCLALLSPQKLPTPLYAPCMSFIACNVFMHFFISLSCLTCHDHLESNILVLCNLLPTMHGT